MHLFGKMREPDEMAGHWRQLYLTRAATTGAQDRPGRRLRVGDADLAVASTTTSTPRWSASSSPDDAWKAKPGLVRNEDE